MHERRPLAGSISSRASATPPPRHAYSRRARGSRGRARRSDGSSSTTRISLPAAGHGAAIVVDRTARSLSRAVYDRAALRRAREPGAREYAGAVPASGAGSPARCARSMRSPREPAPLDGAKQVEPAARLQYRLHWRASCRSASDAARGHRAGARRARGRARGRARRDRRGRRGGGARGGRGRRAARLGMARRALPGAARPAAAAAPRRSTVADRRPRASLKAPVARRRARSLAARDRRRRRRDGRGRRRGRHEWPSGRRALDRSRRCGSRAPIAARQARRPRERLVAAEQLDALEQAGRDRRAGDRDADRLERLPRLLAERSARSRSACSIASAVNGSTPASVSAAARQSSRLALLRSDRSNRKPAYSGYCRDARSSPGRAAPPPHCSSGHACPGRRGR